MSAARVIAIVGAECTGKSTLARELAATLAAEGRRVAHVEEHLREWCDAQRRTPRADEQVAILREQHRRIDAAAAAGHDVVVCDTTGLMTAVYSRFLFGDVALDAEAAGWHRRVDATLLTALDLPWEPDGHQRDGAHVREPVDSLLRDLLLAHRLPFAVIAGAGPRRLAAALAALPRGWREASPPRGGLFTRLASDSAAAPGGWRCECCVPEAERLSRRAAG